MQRVLNRPCLKHLSSEKREKCQQFCFLTSANVLHVDGISVQCRPLADWTDCFQSGPEPKGDTRYALCWPRKLTLSIEAA